MPAVLQRPTPTRKSDLGIPALRFAAEIAVNSSVEGRVDKEAGVIKRVKLVGVQSNNLARTIGYGFDAVGPAANQPYSYAIAGLNRAKPLYENASVYQNHLPFNYDAKSGSRQIAVAERPNDHLLGWIKNVIVIETGNPETDGLYGDFYYIKSHSFTPVLVEVAERNPEKLALSHEAYFDDAKVINGRLVIQELKKVAGLALVNQEPGTTKSLFETHFQEPNMPATATFRQVLESSVGDDAQVQQARLLLELMSGPPFDTVADAPAPPEMAAATPAAPVNADQAIKAAFKSAVIACFDDPSLDLMATIHKIDDLLNALETIAGPAMPLGGVPAPGGADPVVEAGDEAPAEGDEPAAESEADPAEGEEPADGKEKKPPFAKESTEVDRGPLIIECSGLLTAAGIMPTANVLESMAALPTPEKRTAYVAELKAMATPATGTKTPAVPVPRSTIPTPGVNPAKPVAESKLPEYKPGDMARGFFGRL